MLELAAEVEDGAGAVVAGAGEGAVDDGLQVVVADVVDGERRGRDAGDLAADLVVGGAVEGEAAGEREVERDGHGPGVVGLRAALPALALGGVVGHVLGQRGEVDELALRVARVERDEDPVGGEAPVDAAPRVDLLDGAGHADDPADGVDLGEGTFSCDP